MNKTLALIEKGKNGRFGVFTPLLTSTISGEGATVEEARRDFLQSYRETLDYFQETKEPLPDELRDLTFEYKYDLPSLFNDFSWINVSVFAREIGINASLMRQYKGGGVYISSRQAGKIESAFHTLAERMLEVKLK